MTSHSSGPFGISPVAGDFHCGRCGTLLDGGTDEPVAARELRERVGQLDAMLKASEEHTQYHEDEAIRLREALERIADTKAWLKQGATPKEIAEEALRS